MILVLTFVAMLFVSGLSTFGESYYQIDDHHWTSSIQVYQQWIDLKARETDLKSHLKSLQSLNYQLDSLQRKYGDNTYAILGDSLFIGISIGFISVGQFQFLLTLGENAKGLELDLKDRHSSNAEIEAVAYEMEIQLRIIANKSIDLSAYTNYFWSSSEINTVY